MSKEQSKNFTLGILLIVFGGLFLAKNMGFIPYDIFHYLFRWYNWLILIGIIVLIKHPQKTSGYILLGIGGFFFARDLDFIPYVEIRLLWPLFLIGAGIYYIIRQQSKDMPKGEKPDGSMDFIDDTNLFSGGDVVIESDNFRGGRVSSMFGGGNYNLTKAKLSPDTTNVLDVFAMFGGSNFIVPPDWNVRIEVTAIFGGFSDKRQISNQPTVEGDPKKELFIKGFVMFGGGEVKSY
ncbi:MAG: cell wall-active antibiotics response protein [Cyclobacteriaceae bacterium]|nr:cell wall-active antibiotics response protein [Cyclobacteriaceae bacterium]